MNAPRPAVFAIPGDIETRTGGFIYERLLLEGLRRQGREVAHLQLPASFPDPDAADMTAAVAALREVPTDRPIILDGLVFGAIDTAGLAQVRAPICAMIHHPLALESGLHQQRAAELHRREAENVAIAGEILVPSPHTASILRADYGAVPERITVAPPGFPPAKGRGRPSSPPLILSVGILHPRKGHDTLLQALSRLTDLDWRAEIVGAAYDPTHAAELARLRKALGLRDRVRLAGSLGETELDALYASATVFALATRYEGYGMVFGEALGHGLPIVACATGAVPDTVPAGTGHLVPADDPESFAAALRHCLEDDAVREQFAVASERAGRALPQWDGTAAIAGRVLDRLAEV